MAPATRGIAGGRASGGAGSQLRRSRALGVYLAPCALAGAAPAWALRASRMT